MSKKQKTLFNIWGGKAKSGREEEPGSYSQPRIESGASVAGAQTVCVDEEDFAFLEDEVTDAQLLEVCDLTEEGNSKHNYESDPQTSEGSVLFHIGPSASDHSILNLSIVKNNISGFDPQAGEIWIYPTNYPVRDYQFNIVSKALFVNTLVSLPTGLGKTFIAAVLMYNYYRWYPSGKVVFLAPTKPLVSQQIEACYHVMGIPQDHTTEMTGSMMPKDRVLMWQKKHIFFLTPQVMQNDLSRGACPAMDVSCVVFDEAHKALGNHAYCQVIKRLTAAGGDYRVLALSATPGNDLKAVQQVVSNLQISHIELRSEESFDIQPYIHERKVEKIVVPLVGEILDIKNRFEKILSKVLARLCKCGVLYHGIPDRMSKFQLLQARDQFRVTGPPEGVMVGAVEGDFALSISLCHAFELLQLHGMQSFHQFLKNTFCSDPFPRQSIAKQDVIRSPVFNGIMKQLANKFRETCSDGIGNRLFPITVGVSAKTKNMEEEGERKQDFFYSHPKLHKLEEIMLEHFRALKDGDSSSFPRPVTTRVMIFSEYRESVQEISNMLSQHTPLIRAMTFVGHSASKSTSKGLTQKEQIEIVRKFRKGGYNTLVATCVGEEGLDIGEVDLIICFDAAKSPVRLVQRMGRTGRRRSGRIVVLIAAGKEEGIYNKSQSSKKSIDRAIGEGCKKIKLYQHCPRMVPRHVHPRVHKMHMTVKEFVDTKVARKLSSGKERSTASQNMFLNEQQLSCWSKELALSDREFRVIEKSVGRCLSSKASFMSIESLRNGTSNDLLDLDASHSIFSDTHRKSITPPSARSKSIFRLSLDKWTHLQTAPIPTKVIGHSSKSHALMSLLEFADLLQTGECMGENYDLEMRTFLKEADIKLSSSGNLLPTSAVGKRAKASKVRKKHQVIVDLSDDEDFKDSIVEKAVPSSPQRDTTVIAETQELEDVLKGARHHDIRERLGDKDSSRSTSNDDANERVKKGEGDMSHRCDYFTASQHVIPRPPLADSFSWLDEIEPSQTEMNYSPLSCSPKDGIERGKERGKGRMVEPASEKEEHNFQFITPSSPPSRRQSRIFTTSTPNHFASKLSTSTQRRKMSDSPLRVASENKTDTYHESIDLFDDLSMRDIFDEFSVSGLQGMQEHVASGKKTCGIGKKEGENVMLVESGDIAIMPRDMDLEKEEEMAMEEKRLAGSNEFVDDHSVGVSVIAESDVEQLDDEDQTKAATEVENCYPLVTASLDPADGFCEVMQHDNSYPLHVGRRRKRCKMVQFLESPSPNGSFVEKDKEEKIKRRRVDENTEDVSTISSNLAQPSASAAIAGKRELRCSGYKKFPVVLDSSEEDGDDMPMMKRLYRNRRTFAKRRKMTFDSDVATDGGWDRKVCEFVEEEAQVSSPEEEKEGSFEVEEGSGDNYDMEDSFINDNSMLTQYTPNRKNCKIYTRSGNECHSTCELNDPYPICSQRDEVFARRKCHAARSRYRMAFSQRYHLLHHYMDKVDGTEANSGQKRQRKQRKNVVDRSCDSSGSEAEEVNVAYGEEEWDELASSLIDAEEVDVTYGEEEWDDLSGLLLEAEECALSKFDCVSEPGGGIIAICGDKSDGGEGRVDGKRGRGGGYKRKAGFLSDSEEDLEKFGECVRRSEMNPANYTKNCDNRLAANLEASHIEEEREKEVQFVDISRFRNIVISPSLLKDVKIVQTPPFFFGMDDWLMDIDYEDDQATTPATYH